MPRERGYLPRSLVLIAKPAMRLVELNLIGRCQKQNGDPPIYIPYDGPNLANQNCRKLGIFN